MNHRFTVEPMMLYLTSPGIMFLEQDEVFNPFKEQVDAIDPRVIILDCLSGFYGGDENDGAQISGIIRKISQLQNDFTRSVVVIHHSNKNLMATGIDKSRGHSKLVGWVDTIIHMVNQPNSKQLQFGKVRHANAETHSINIAFENVLWRRI